MRFLYLAAAIFGGVLLSPVFIQAQSNERIINLYHRPNEPLKILSIKAKDKEIQPDQKFVSEDDDWFRDLAVEVENTSNQTIVYLEMSLKFPIEEGRTRIPAGDYIWYGSRKWYVSGKKVLSSSQSPLKPGEKATIKLNDYQGIRNFLDKVGYGKSLKEFRLDISLALFDNDISWHSGQIMIRDGNDPERWTRQPKLSN